MPEMGLVKGEMRGHLSVKRNIARIVQIHFLALVVLSAASLRADTGGSISGTVKDASGGVIQGTAVVLRNVDTSISQTANTNGEGVYAFPAVSVGHYELQISADGFKPYKRTNLAIDVGTKLLADVTLEVGSASQEITVSDTAIHVETASTQIGEVVSGEVITAVALNGRSFTDLMSLQPGIVPMTTQAPDSIVMAGVTVAIAPSGDLNAGNQSISGQREDANGFMINGGDVKELMNGGTSIVPNLDSIAEFRILINNFDAQYGNYSGGVVNVATKSGTNLLHGSGFEFLRNTSLDARSFFSPQKAVFRQNQFGGTVGGPIVKSKLFFFGDYQGTRTTQGIDTGQISVPSLLNRTGNLADQDLSGSVSGPYIAGILSQKLGRTVTAGEPYASVFPGNVIPISAWSEPAKHLIQFIPLPNVGISKFSTAGESKIVRDDKTSLRLDADISHWGQLSGYYYFDDYHLNNPYPTGQGGATVPGFDALTLGRAQLISLGDTKTFGSSTVNELHFSFMRNANVVGKPQGGVGPTLASQGFVTGPGSTGINPIAPEIEGIENVRFNSFLMGLPITNLVQANNTFSVVDNLSRIIGNHTIMVGLQGSVEQVNVDPDATFNGSFLFTGSETGSDFADFLVGVANNYNQADSKKYYARHKYIGGFGQDSWRVRSNLTLNFGLRWELMQYWSEKYNQVPTFVVGQQSKVFTTAPTGLVYAGDDGVPNTLVPRQNRFSPRLGLAYAPNTSTGFLGKLLGGPGKTSIRAGWGVYMSVIEGNLLAIDEPQPPYGLSYTSPSAPIFAEPFRAADDGSVHVNPFPLTVPPYGITQQKPFTTVDYSPFLPQAGMTAPPPSNTYPYSENYFLSIERGLGANTVLSLSYVGSQAHHLIVVYSANPGNPALCLALSDPTALAPGEKPCGPGGEDSDYVTASGKTIHGTRGPLGSNFANDDYSATAGNSSYNSFQANLRRSAKGLAFSIGYTYSKSMDQASSISDVVNPFNPKLNRALSAWDLTHTLVASYQYRLPLDRLTHRVKFLTQGWAISGITRASTGFPVTISSESDNSLQGSVPNGVNNRFLDTPDFASGPLGFNSHTGAGQTYFDTSLFSPNALGEPGTANRRFFHGPGMFNTDLTLSRNMHIGETRALEFRLETFNIFNHPQFFGPVAVNGDIDNNSFGQIVNAAPPRLMQLGLKFTF
jgi:hypothetical protein